MFVANCLVGALGVLLYLPAQANGQTPPELSRQSIFGGNEDYETIIVPILHSPCASVNAALQDVEIGLATSCARPDRLLLRGPAELLEEVRDVLIPKIDVPGTDGDSYNNAFIMLDHYPASDLAELLDTVAVNYDSRIAVDKTDRMLVVHATEAEVGAIRAIVAQLDKPSQSLTAHFYFISASIDSEADYTGGILGIPLEPVAAALAKNGFGDVALLAPIIVAVNEGHPFQHLSTLINVEAVGPGNSLTFSIEGIARLDSHEDIVQLQLAAEIVGSQSPSERGARQTKFEVSTTVVMNLDKYVILAAAPGRTADGDAIAMAVRVSRN